MRKMLNWSLLIILVAIPLVLLILPSHFFDSGPPSCLSVWILGKTCFACGITRGIMHLIHFDFAGAYFYNPLSFVVFPIVVLLYLRWLSGQLFVTTGIAIFLKRKKKKA
ncbi:MAG: DUF2752 domain-containing protein [Bacteroidetes bacterium]|nr:DUF2752 domain-containing protein [Bacteroidota bacterium]